MRLIGAGTRDGFEYTVHTTFWTAPNVITVVRFLLVPVFIWFLQDAEHMGAFWVLVALGATDWIDGFIARYFNQLSTVGRWLDPLADRLAMVVVTLGMVYFDVLPVWVFWTVFIPDLVLFVNAALLFLGTPHLPVSVMGKVRTAGLMVALPLMLLAQISEFAERLNGLFPLMAESLLFAACVLHVIASADYFVQAYLKFFRLRRHGLRPWDRKTWARPHPPAEARR